MKNYLKKIALLVLLVFSFSCKQEVRNKNFIDRLSSIQNGLPSLYFNYYLYFKVNNGKILETNIDLVYEIYKNYYSEDYKNFNSYLENLFNEKETIKAEHISTLKKKGDVLANMSVIDNDIAIMSIENLEKQYLNLEKQNTFILRTGKIEPIKVKTILYKMFINDYIITFSDYGGYYIIKKYNEKDFK